MYSDSVNIDGQERDILRAWYSVKERDRQSGVGMLLSQNTQRSLTGYDPVNDRILKVRLKGRPVNADN